MAITFGGMAKAIADWKGEQGDVTWLNWEYQNTQFSDKVLGIIRRNVDRDESDTFYLVAEFIQLLELAPSEAEGAMQIASWPSAAKRHVGPARRERQKIGKAFRRVMPEISDAECERCVDDYRKTFDLTQFKIEIVTGGKEIAAVYTGDVAPMQNLATTYFRKNISYSCMRHTMGDFHPTAAYGTPDWQMYVAREKATGRIASRAMVNVAKAGEPCQPHHAPIYGVSECAVDALEKLFKQSGISPAENGAFIGATLVAHMVHGSQFKAPYLDIEPRSYFYDEDMPDVLTIQRDGNVTGCNHVNGLQDWDDGDSCQCCHCNERLDEDDARADSDGNYWCDDCYNENFSYCVWCEESVPNDETATAYLNDRRGNAEEICVCEDCRRRHFTMTISDEYWLDSDVITLANGDSISPHDDYFVSDWDGECYLPEDMCETEDGENVSRDELKSRGWQEDDDGLWYDPESRAPDLSPLDHAPCLSSRACAPMFKPAVLPAPPAAIRAPAHGMSVLTASECAVIDSVLESMLATDWIPIDPCPLESALNAQCATAAE